jgi:hypothetical protein
VRTAPSLPSKRRSTLSLALAAIAGLSGIEQIAYPRGEALLCDRLLDHRDAGIEPTLVDDGVSGITRREQNLETGSLMLCLFRQLPTIDAG